jgi:RNA polymerase sigma factor (sigma-70 family)
MEVSALKHSGGIGLHARSPLLRLQSDERLVALVRRGNSTAFEVLVSRYHSRLLSFCRHLLGSREDAEDVLQEVMAAAFNAILADDRPINVRPWLYRIARNRSLNHLRRIQAIGVDSMDVHLSEHGVSTADKVHGREEFRLLVGDIHELPETQKTALVLREMDALSYEQIADAMETTVPSVKSLLVRARVSLAEAAEARLLSCEEVRIELGELAEGLRRRSSPLVRRHLRACKRCSAFRIQLKQTNKALTAILPIGPMVILKKLVITHLGHSAGSGATAAGSGATAAGSTAAAGGTLVVGSGAGGFVSAGFGAIATKAAAGLAAAALVTAGAVEVGQPSRPRAARHPTAALLAPVVVAPTVHATRSWATAVHQLDRPAKLTAVVAQHPDKTKAATVAAVAVKPVTTTTTTATTKTSTDATPPPATPPGRTQTQTDPTVLTPPSAPPPTMTTVAATPPPPTTASAPVIAPPPTTTTTTTTTTSTAPPPAPSSP